MASATVGVLRVVLTADSAEFTAAMQKAAGQAQLWSGHLQKVGQQASQVGMALTKSLTLPIAAIGVTSVKAAMDFESSFANVAKTVDGVSDAAGKLTPKGEALAQTFRTMAKEIPATTAELNAIAAMGGQMGVPIEQLEHFTRNVAALGVAVDGISAEEAAASLASIGNATGTGTTKIQEMASALVHLGNNSNATEADILEFTKRLVGAGHSAGMTVPEVMAIGTAMANVGINAEAGGTAMSTVIGKIGKAVSLGSADLQEFARVAGVSADAFSAVWKRSSAEGIDLFVKGLSTMKARGVDLNLTMGELGTEGIRVASTLKLLAGAGDGVSKSIGLANQGYAAGNKHLEEAEKKYGTAANQLKKLGNQVTDIGITIGNALLPALKSMTSLLTTIMPLIEGIAKAFAALPGPIQAVIVGLGLVLAAAGPVLFIFGQLIQSMGTVIGLFAKKGAAARALALILGETSTAAATTATSVTAVGTASAGAAPKVVTFGTAVRGVAAAFGTVAIVGTWLWALSHTVSAVQSLNAIMREGNERIGAFRMSLSNLLSLPGIDKIQILGGILQAMRGGASTTPRPGAGSTMQDVFLPAPKPATIAAASTAITTLTRKLKDYTGEIDKAAVATAKLQTLVAGLSPGLHEGISSMPGVNVGRPDLEAVLIPDIIFDTHTKLQEGISKMPGLEFPIAPPKLDIPLFGREFGQQLGGVLVNAFRGGGVMGAIADGASLVGSTLMTGLATKLTSGANAITGWLGGMISSALPLIGSLIGPLIDKIAGLFGNKGRDLVKDFAASFGGFDALHAQLGTLGAAGEKLWIQLTQGVGRNNPQQAQAAIDAITEALGRAEAEMTAFNSALGGMLQEIQSLGQGLPATLVEYLRGLEKAGQLTQENIDLLNELAGQGEADWRKIEEAVERYGGDISTLGGTFQAQRLHDSWMQVIDDMALFEAGGMDAAQMLDLTQGKIIELVQQSQKFGTEIPENMRPWIEKLIESGELVDESGDKITDIGKLTFGETLQTSLEKLTDEIRRLITTLGGVPAAAESAAKGAEDAFSRAKPTLKVGVVYEDDGRPRYDYPERDMTPSLAARGGLVTPWGVQYRQIGGAISRAFPRRGTDTVPAMLTPGEVILNEAHQATIGDTLAAAMRAAHAVFQAPALMMDAVQRSAGTSGGPLQAVTVLEVDKRELGRAVADVLPGELRRLGVRVLA